MAVGSTRSTRSALGRLGGALIALAVLLSAAMIFRAPSPAVSAAFIAVAALAGSCGLVGTLLLPRGSGGARRVLWAALGLLLALAIPTMMSVGVFYLAAAALTGFALATMPGAQERPWWHPRDAWLGLFAFTVALWTLFLVSR